MAAKSRGESAVLRKISSTSMVTDIPDGRPLLSLLEIDVSGLKKTAILVLNHA